MASAEPMKTRRSFSLRLLPVAIFTLVMMLGVRMGDLWTGLETGQWTEMSGLAVQVSLAQQAAAPAPAAAKPAPEAPVPAEKGAQAALRTGELPDDPALLSQAEIDLLQKLSDRRKQLDKWSQELEMREGLLKAAEQRIDGKVDELRTIQTKIRAMLRQYDKEQEEKLKSLVKIYEAMKAKDAARIFMELEMPVLLDVVERMREAKASAIIANLDPQKAKDVTAELVARRKIGAEARSGLPSSDAGEPRPSSTDAPPPSSSGTPPGSG